MTPEEEVGALIVALDNANDTIERLAARINELNQINSELNIQICTAGNGGKQYAKFPTTTGG